MRVLATASVLLATTLVAGAQRPPAVYFPPAPVGPPAPAPKPAPPPGVSPTPTETPWPVLRAEQRAALTREIPTARDKWLATRAANAIPTPVATPAPGGTPANAGSPGFSCRAPGFDAVRDGGADNSGQADAAYALSAGLALAEQLGRKFVIPPGKYRLGSALTTPAAPACPAR